MDSDSRFYMIFASSMEELVVQLNDIVPDTHKVIYVGLSYDKDRAFTAVVDSCFSIVVTPEMMIDHILRDAEEPNEEDTILVTRAGIVTPSA